MTIREHRMETEWRLLESLAEANRRVFVDLVRSQNEFRITLRDSPAWVRIAGEPRVETEHTLRYVYPRYYPSLPLEGYFVRPISHINVDSVTGFVCLWQDYRPAQTIVDAILVTRAIMAYQVANWHPDHRMQPDTDLELAQTHTLPMPPLTLPMSCRTSISQSATGSRRRLTSVIDEQTPSESNRALFNIE